MQKCLGSMQNICFQDVRLKTEWTALRAAATPTTDQPWLTSELFPMISGHVREEKLKQ